LHWSIKIIRAPGGTAAFKPHDVRVREGDLITWLNTTDEPHWPWPTDAAGRLLPSPFHLSDLIAGHEASQVLVAVRRPPQTVVIHYCCKLHPEIRGKISFVDDDEISSDDDDAEDEEMSSAGDDEPY
jgi:plastocyanin